MRVSGASGPSSDDGGTLPIAAVSPAGGFDGASALAAFHRRKTQAQTVCWCGEAVCKCLSNCSTANRSPGMSCSISVTTSRSPGTPLASPVLTEAAAGSAGLRAASSSLAERPSLVAASDSSRAPGE